jgi:hypothetical protein
LSATVKDILIDAKQRIEDNKNWCKYNIAENKNGKLCYPTDGEAIKWCAMGSAICSISKLVTRKDREPVGLQLQESLHSHAVEYGYDGLADANDMGGHSVVMEIFDEVIANV